MLDMVRSLLGKKMSPKRIEKVSRLAANPFAQPDVRMEQMQKLLKDDTDLALRGLLKRFAANASGPIADEEEKKWLEDQLVEVGEAAAAPLRDYIASAVQISYALRTYQRVAGADEAKRFFLHVLKQYGPEDHRSVESKVQLVLHLAEFTKEAALVVELTPFLADHSDEVAWAVMDVIDKVFAADTAKTVDTLDDAVRGAVSARLAWLVTEESVAPRLQKRAAEMFLKHRLAFPEERRVLTKSLEAEYLVDKKGFLRQRRRGQD